MFCYQCEQTAQGSGCSAHGVCGKDPETAAMQDLIIHQAKEIAKYAAVAAAQDIADERVDYFIIRALFATVTNVDFDPTRLAEIVFESLDVLELAKKLYDLAGGTEEIIDDCNVDGDMNMNQLIDVAETCCLDYRVEAFGEDVVGVAGVDSLRHERVGSLLGSRLAAGVQR